MPTPGTSILLVWKIFSCGGWWGETATLWLLSNNEFKFMALQREFTLIVACQWQFVNKKTGLFFDLSTSSITHTLSSGHAHRKIDISRHFSLYLHSKGGGWRSSVVAVGAWRSPSLALKNPCWEEGVVRSLFDKRTLRKLFFSSEICGRKLELKYWN